MYADSEAVFQLSNPSAGVGTAGLLLRGQQGANLGMYGYLVNINTNGGEFELIESGYIGMLAWNANTFFDMSLLNFAGE